MLEWFTDPFALGFQQRALMGGIIAGLMTSVVGTWVVLRGMTFFGDAFVHGVVPGIAAAVVLDFSPYLGAALAAIVIVAGVEWIHRQTTLKEDTGIGLLFVGMLALGVVIISTSSAYSGSLTSILFGDALGVTRSDLIVQSVLAVVVISGSLLLYRPLLALTFDRTKAATLGMRPSRTHAALLALIAAAVIGSYQAVGTLLVFGLLVAPPATAALIARTIPGMMAWAAGISVFSVWLGLTLSYHWGTAGSATMALVPVVLFFLVLIGTRVVGRITRRRLDAAAAGATPSGDPPGGSSTAATTPADRAAGGSTR